MRTLLALVLLLPLGCGGGAGAGSAQAPLAVAPSLDPASEPPAGDPLGATPAELAEEDQALADLREVLRVELALDAAQAERAEALLRRAWSDTRAEVARRLEALEPLDEETVSELLEARQRALDLELSALLTPAQQERFRALGARLEEAQ